MRPFPVISFDELWHVGTFDPSHKRSDSLEGAGLSVSLHPEEWMGIARLGGQPTWEMTKEDNSFLHAHHISLGQKRHVMNWALDRGLVEPCDLWRWRRFDDELDCFIVSHFESREEARDEADDGEDGTYGTVRKVKGHRSTALLDQLAVQSSPTTGSDLVLDLVLPLYADEVLGLDGVWWDDILDPCGYSAPRGVIALSKLPTWSRQLDGVELLRAA